MNPDTSSADPGFDADDYEVAPPEVEPDPPEPREISVDVDAAWEENFQAELRESRRYTLLDMMVVLAAASLVLVIARLLPLSIAAALLGLMVALGIPLLSPQMIVPPWLRLMWVAVAVLYAVVALIAVVAP